MLKKKKTRKRRRRGGEKLPKGGLKSYVRGAWVRGPSGNQC